MPQSVIERPIEKVLERSLSDRAARSATRGPYLAIRRRRAESLPLIMMYEVSEFTRAFSQDLQFRRPARASALYWRMRQDRKMTRYNRYWDPVSGPHDRDSSTLR